MAQPTGRPRGRPPGSKNKSTLERERKEKEKVLNESRDEIVNEVVKKVEKMVDNKMDVTTPPRGDRGIVLGGFAGTYQKVAQKGQFSLLKSEQFGDRAYMVLLKGKKVVAKDIATMNDARVVKAIGRPHRKADASRISKNTPGEMEDKFNEAAHLLIDIADWCESQGLYVTVDKVRTLVNRIDSAFEVFYDEVTVHMSSEDDDWGTEKARKSKIKKDTYGDNLSPEDEVRVRGMISQIRAIEEYVDRAYRAINTEAYGLESVPGFQQMFAMAEGFGDVDITNAIWDYKKSIEEYAKAIRAQNIPQTDGRWPSKFSDELEWRLREFISGKYAYPSADTSEDPIQDADYDLSQYEMKSKKGSQSKAPVKDDRGSIGIDIEKMIRTKKESKEKPETDLDEPIEAPDEPPVTQGEKPDTNPDEPIEAPSESAVSDKGKDDDISSLESSAGPTVIANGNDGSELDIDIDLDDDEDLEKMMARKEKMQSQAEPPGRTQPFSNNYRTVQMGAGKFNTMDMPKGRNVKP